MDYKSFALIICAGFTVIIIGLIIKDRITMIAGGLTFVIAILFVLMTSGTESKPDYINSQRLEK